MQNIDVSQLVKTKAQARELSIRIASVAEQVFQNNFSLEQALSEQFGIQKKDLLLTILRNNQVNTEKPSAMKEFLTKLQEHINTLPVLSITLAVEPTEKTLRILSDWFLMNLKRQVLLDISVEPSLIAGIAIHYNGRFLDFSVRERVQTVIQGLVTPQHSVTQSTPAPQPISPLQQGPPASATQASPVNPVIPQPVQQQHDQPAQTIHTL